MTVYHLVDHEGFGTIHKLLIPLCRKYTNHKLLKLKNGRISHKKLYEINRDKNSYVIIHSTCSNNSFYLNNCNRLFRKNSFSIFLHTSSEYQKVKKREHVLKMLEEYSNKYGVCVFTPSLEVTQQYLKNNIKSYPIQLGIPPIEDVKQYRKFNPKLKDYYNKIITTCSSDKTIYKYVKGIDIYENFIFDNKLDNYALILGTNNKEKVTVPNVKLSEQDFLNVLFHSKCYIQFSRYETYNVTAIQAKRFKIPVLITSVEGTPSCMGEHVYLDCNSMLNDIKKVLDGKYDKEKLENLYQDSVERESIKNFKNSLEQTIRSVKYEFTKKSI